MARRQEFTRTTKLSAWDRSGGRCEACGRKLYPGDGIEYDHVIACEHGGDNSLDNCQVLCRACHVLKSGEDIAITARGRRARARHAGATTKKHKLPGSKGSGLRRRMDGSVWRE